MLPFFVSNIEIGSNAAMNSTISRVIRPHSLNRLAFCGKKCCGKSTLTSFLVKNYNYREMSFADPLKKTVIDLFRIDPKYCYDPEWKEQIIPKLNVSARTLLQITGTELFRNALPKLIPELTLEFVNEDKNLTCDTIDNKGNDKSLAKTNTSDIKKTKCSLWIYSMYQRLEEVSLYDKIVISDLRFEDEAEALRALGFTIIRITRPGKGTDKDIDCHSSESGCSYDLEILNDKTIDDLHNQYKEQITLLIDKGLDF